VTHLRPCAGARITQDAHLVGQSTPIAQSRPDTPDGYPDGTCCGLARAGVAMLPTGHVLYSSMEMLIGVQTVSSHVEQAWEQLHFHHCLQFAVFCPAVGARLAGHLGGLPSKKRRRKAVCRVFCFKSLCLRRLCLERLRLQRLSLKNLRKLLKRVVENCWEVLGNFLKSFEVPAVWHRRGLFGPCSSGTLIWPRDSRSAHLRFVVPSIRARVPQVRVQDSWFSNLRGWYLDPAPRLPMCSSAPPGGYLGSL
jgi:hypothetical protein